MKELVVRFAKMQDEDLHQTYINLQAQPFFGYLTAYAVLLEAELDLRWSEDIPGSDAREAEAEAIMEDMERKLDILRRRTIRGDF
jgi:hypothetical protein